MHRWYTSVPQTVSVTSSRAQSVRWCRQMFTVLLEPVSRLKAKHCAFPNSYLSATIQGDEFFPGEDRVRMLGTEIMTDKAG